MEGGTNPGMPTDELMSIAIDRAKVQFPDAERLGKAEREAAAKHADFDKKATELLATLETAPRQGVSFTCPSCGDVKNTRDGMKYHLQQRVCLKKQVRQDVMATSGGKLGRTTFLCPLCSRSFFDLGVLRVHLDERGCKFNAGGVVHPRKKRKTAGPASEEEEVDDSTDDEEEEDESDADSDGTESELEDGEGAGASSSGRKRSRGAGAPLPAQASSSSASSSSGGPRPRRSAAAVATRRLQKTGAGGKKRREGPPRASSSSFSPAKAASDGAPHGAGAGGRAGASDDDADDGMGTDGEGSGDNNDDDDEEDAPLGEMSLADAVTRLAAARKAQKQRSPPPVTLAPHANLVADSVDAHQRILASSCRSLSAPGSGSAPSVSSSSSLRSPARRMSSLSVRGDLEGVIASIQRHASANLFQEGGEGGTSAVSASATLRALVSSFAGGQRMNGEASVADAGVGRLGVAQLRMGAARASSSSSGSSGGGASSSSSDAADGIAVRVSALSLQPESPLDECSSAGGPAARNRACPGLRTAFVACGLEPADSSAHAGIGVLQVWSVWSPVGSPVKPLGGASSSSSSSGTAPSTSSSSSPKPPRTLHEGTFLFNGGSPVDVAWHPNVPPDAAHLGVLAVACSDCAVRVFSVPRLTTPAAGQQQEVVHLQPVASYDASGNVPSVVQWCPSLEAPGPFRLAVGDASGQVAVLDVTLPRVERAADEAPPVETPKESARKATGKSSKASQPAARAKARLRKVVDSETEEEEEDYDDDGFTRRKRKKPAARGRGWPKRRVVESETENEYEGEEDEDEDEEAEEEDDGHDSREEKKSSGRLAKASSKGASLAPIVIDIDALSNCSSVDMEAVREQAGAISAKGASDGRDSAPLVHQLSAVAVSAAPASPPSSSSSSSASVGDAVVSLDWSPLCPGTQLLALFRSGNVRIYSLPPAAFSAPSAAVDASASVPPALAVELDLPCDPAAAASCHVTAAQFAPDGLSLLLGSADGRVTLVDQGTFLHERTLLPAWGPWPLPVGAGASSGSSLAVVSPRPSALPKPHAKHLRPPSIYGAHSALPAAAAAHVAVGGCGAAAYPWAALLSTSGTCQPTPCAVVSPALPSLPPELASAIPAAVDDAAGKVSDLLQRAGVALVRGICAPSRLLPLRAARALQQQGVDASLPATRDSDSEAESVRRPAAKSKGAAGGNGAAAASKAAGKHQPQSGVEEPADDGDVLVEVGPFMVFAALDGASRGLLSLRSVDASARAAIVD